MYNLIRDGGDPNAVWVTACTEVESVSVPFAEMSENAKSLWYSMNDEALALVRSMRHDPNVSDEDMVEALDDHFAERYSDRW
jgi:hypothetical protein